VSAFYRFFSWRLVRNLKFGGKATFFFCMLLLNQNTTYLQTQSHLGGDIHWFQKFYLMDICFPLPRSIPAITEKRTRKIVGTRSSKFVFYALECSENQLSTYKSGPTVRVSFTDHRRERITNQCSFSSQKRDVRSLDGLSGIVGFNVTHLRQNVPLRSTNIRIACVGTYWTLLLK